MSARWARELEALGCLQMTLQRRLGTGHATTFKFLAERISDTNGSILRRPTDRVRVAARRIATDAVAMSAIGVGSSS
jgi:hypothetical protein